MRRGVGDPHPSHKDLRMHIYLKHPVHGSKVAISDMEVEADVQNGWEVYNLDAPVVEAAPVNELKRRRKTE
jgi:hypothetical protein